MNRRKHHGFTLVELLVVIAIIGILIGILLPAIQLAREAGRRTACKSNIAQVGTAVLNYELATGHFPVGTTEPSGGPIENTPTGKHIGWIVQILPYLGEGATAKHFDRELGAYASANDPVRKIGLAILSCASRYNSISGPDEYGPGTNYAACHNDTESPIDDDNNGMMCLNIPIRESEVTDGLSNTIMLGEKRIKKADLGWVSGTRATLRNTGTVLDPELYLSWEETRDLRERQTAFEWTDIDNWEEDSEVGDEKDPAIPTYRFELNEDPAVRQYVGGFESYHAAVVNFVMGDGSVSSVSKSMNPEILQQLGHRADGRLLTGGPSRIDWQDTEVDWER